MNDRKKVVLATAILIVVILVLSNNRVQNKIKISIHRLEYSIKYRNQSEQENDGFNEDYISPTDEQTIVLTIPYLAGKSSNKIPYLFTNENVADLETIEGVEYVYPTASLLSTGYTAGITMSSNQYINKAYDIVGDLYPDVVWDQDIDLTPLEAKDFLTNEQFQIADENNKLWKVTDGGYGSVVVPMYPFEATSIATFDTNYKMKLLAGDYPADSSNQLLLSDKLAYTICDQREDCNKINDLIGTDLSLTVSGYFKAANIQDVTITGNISGIYMAERGYNNVVLSYDPNLSATDQLTAANVELALKINSSSPADNQAPIDDLEQLKRALYSQASSEVKAAEADGSFGLYTQIVVKVSADVEVKSVIDQINQFDKKIYINRYEETE